MNTQISRRIFLAGATALSTLRIQSFAGNSLEVQSPVHLEFPAQNPELVREMVGVSHGNIARVEALLELHPALAKATWDWGYGDWETALGAASHTGNREIALLLVANGARPDLFTFAMFGQLEVVKAYVNASPGIQRIKGPHGLTLHHHARVGGPESSAVLDYLETLGDANLTQSSEPLTQDEKQIYVGEYSFGVGPSDRLIINLDKNGFLGIKRLPSGTNRAIFYLGNHEFYPTGAPAVRLRFDVRNGSASELSVIDGSPIVTAARV